MAEIERLTVTLPAEMAADVKAAVEDGQYASNSDVVREALRDWKMKRAIRQKEFALLKADIDKGLADIAAGRVRNFDPHRVAKRGKKQLAGRSSSG